MPVPVVLCLPVRGAGADARVLLGVKKRGFGRGRLVAPGGKIEPGETPAAAAARELEEETGLSADPAGLREAGLVEFRFPADPAADMDCRVFLAEAARGEPRETDELAPEWHPVAGLPAGRMWEDSARWLPEMLAGRRLRVRVELAADNVSVGRYEAAEWEGPAGR